MPTTMITGANRGLGLELARQYAAQGWRVLATCRTPEDACDLNDLAEEHGKLVRVFSLDVTDRAEIVDLARRLAKRVIDVLWLNAGIHRGRGQGPTEVDAEEWVEAHRVNTIAPLAVAGAFAPQVARAKRGRIVFMSSVMGSIGANIDGNNYIYRSTKAAANAVMKSLALDLAPDGITVVAMHPGWTQTDMGGSKAPLSPEESVAGMREVVADLAHSHSGSFLDYRGSPLPW